MFYEPKDLAQRVSLIAKEALEVGVEERRDHFLAIENLFESKLPSDVIHLLLRKIPDETFEMLDAPSVIHIYKFKARLNEIKEELEEFQNKGSFSESDTERLLESLKSIIKKDKRNLIAFIILIFLLKSDGRFDEADIFTKEALNITPKSIVDWLLTSLLVAQTKSYDETEKVRKIFLGGHQTSSRVIHAINSYFALLYTFIFKKYSVAFNLFYPGDDLLQDLLNGLDNAIFEINIKKKIIDTDTKAVLFSLRNKWHDSLGLMKSIICDNEYVKNNIDNINTIFIEATRAGYGKDALALLRGTSAEAVLEPLVVGIERYLRLDTRRRAQEIEEIAEDVKKRIEERKKEYERKEKAQKAQED